MKAILSWGEKVADKDKNEHCIWDVCFQPEGSHMVVAAGSKVLVYDIVDGHLIQALKGHKDIVFCIAYSKDSKNFASGSADKTVIIWNRNLEGILRFTHNDSVQSLSFNPVTHQLASCACTDFGIWASELKTVPKHKLSSRATCSSWTNDGQYLAIGLFSGMITIRNKAGEEKMKIERPSGPASPVWSLQWCPAKNESDLLAVADWGRSLSFYNLAGKQAYKDRSLDFDPASLCWFPKGEYMSVCGSNGELNIYSKEGIRIGQLASQNSWVWSCQVKPDPNVHYVALGCQNGTIAQYTMQYTTVHGLYKERYAYRENMTDVIIHHLITDQKVKIKCRDLVKKIAIYRHRLAIQLPDKVVVYELSSEDPNDMHYKVKDKLQKKLDCNLLVVCSAHIILCQDNKLQSYSFQGNKEKEWTVESMIRYIKVIGGPAGREGLLVGLKNGQIVEIFVDNPFPVSILKQSTAVRCLDLSCRRRKLAVVDEHNMLLVYDMSTKELLYQEPNANSVAWNTQFEDMLCYSGAGFLTVKTGNFQSHQQKIQGFVVGFTGPKVFCLQSLAMSTVEVPQTSALYHYINMKNFKESYRVACLGVTEADWETLGREALLNLDFDLAKQSFTRTRNLQYLQLIASIEDKRRRGENDPQIFLAEMCAYEGRFGEAAKLYKKAGQPSKALNMYTDLRMFEFAKEFVDTADAVDKKQLISKQADWARNINDPKTAAEMYLSAGEYTKAIEIVGDHAWTDMLIDIGRKLDRAERDALYLCAEYLKKLEQFPYAVEMYNKLGDVKGLVKLHVQAKQWEDAFILANRHKDLRNEVYMPYAMHLAEKDQFEEAQQAFHKAGLQTQAVRFLEELTENAVAESRFNDAGFYYWKLSRQCADLAAEDQTKAREMFQKCIEFEEKADIYYAYFPVHRYTEEPFTQYLPEALFHMSRFLLHKLFFQKHLPPGVSKVSVLYTLARQARALGAYKMARHAYEKLNQLRIPARFQDASDVGSVSIRAKPFQDAEDQLHICYRCSSTNPLMNIHGDVCSNCRQPFVHSFISFEILPVVQFYLEDDITDAQAQQLLDQEPPKREKKQWKESVSSNAQSLRMDDDMGLMEDEGDDQDPFTARCMSFDPTGSEFRPVLASREVLRSLPRTEVIICQQPRPLSCLYYKVVLPNVSITQCEGCHKLFHTEDFELAVLQKGHCPYCRLKSEPTHKTDEEED